MPSVSRTGAKRNNAGGKGKEARRNMLTMPDVTDSRPQVLGAKRARKLATSV
jgi:hypothetical protein